MEKKIINDEPNYKTKLKLCYPPVYNSLITFYMFSKFKRRNNKVVNNLYDYDGIKESNKKNFSSYNHRHRQIYENKITF